MRDYGCCVVATRSLVSAQNRTIEMGNEGWIISDNQPAFSLPLPVLLQSSLTYMYCRSTF